jgi:hypothetical protein
MTIKSRVTKLEVQSGSNAPYIIILKYGTTRDEAIAAYFAETGRSPPKPKDLVIALNKP